MKKVFNAFPLLILCFLCCRVANAQRIVGYISSNATVTSLSNVQWNKLTDVYYGNINPSPTGHLLFTSSADPLSTFNPSLFDAVNKNYDPAEQGYNNGITRKLWISLGGSDYIDQSRSMRLSAVTANDTYRTTLVSELVSFAHEHNLEGINIDWQKPFLQIDKSNLERLVVDLRLKIIAMGYSLKLSAIVGGQYKTNIHFQNMTTTAINLLDYVDVMAMDYPNNCADLTQTVKSMKAWSGINSFGLAVPQNKLCMGIPLYGTNLNNAGDYKPYNEETTEYPGIFMGLANTSIYCYNSLNDVNDKIDWIRTNGYGGILLKNVNYDRPHSISTSTSYSYQSLMSQLFYNSVAPTRVVGYIPGAKVSSNPSSLTNVQWTSLTDVYYGSVNPKADGSLNLTNTNDVFSFDANSFAKVQSFCKPANPNGPRLWLSIGGNDDQGLIYARLSSVCNDYDLTSVFFHELLTYVRANNIGGINIDWQYAKITSGGHPNPYDLMTRLNNYIKGYNYDIKLSLTVQGEYQNPTYLSFAQAFANAVDYLDVNTYNYTYASPGPSSSLYDSKEALYSWAGANSYNVQVPKGKLSMSIPFFGNYMGGAVTKPYNTTYDYLSVYFPGSTDGYFYNSSSTVRDKVNFVMANGYAGVFIPDVMDDRTDEYSYQSLIRQTVASACSIPALNMSASGSCNDANNTQVSAGIPGVAGRSFTWYRNEILLDGVKGNGFLGTSPAGINTFRVVVKEGTCMRESSIAVQSGSTIQAASISHCGAANITLTANSKPGGVYEWFEQADQGTPVSTGSQFSTLASTTKTYYLQDSKVETLHTAKQFLDPSFIFDDNSGTTYDSLPKYTQRFVVQKEITIQSLSVYGTVGANLYNAKIQVFAADGRSLLKESPRFVIFRGYQKTTAVNVPVNISLPPGTYYIGLYVPHAAKGIVLHAGVLPNYSLPGIITIESKAYVNTQSLFSPSPTALYGQLFDWVIINHTSACPRKAVNITINPSPLPVSISGIIQVCRNASRKYTVREQPGAKYKWFFDNGHVQIKDNITAAVNTPDSLYSSSITFTPLDGTFSGKMHIIPVMGQCFGQEYVSPDIYVEGINKDEVVGPSVGNPGGFGTEYKIVPQAGEPLYDADYTWLYTGTGLIVNKHDGRNATIYFSSNATPGDLYAQSTNYCGTSTAKAVHITFSSRVRESSVGSPQQLQVLSFPNPYVDHATLEIYLPQSAKVIAKMTHLSTNNEYVIVNNESLESGTYQFDYPSILPSGIYQVQVSDGSSVQTLRVVKVE